MLDDLLLRDFIVPEPRSTLSGDTRLPLQARPDPRGRVRRAREIGAGRAPRALRRLARASGRARSCSRSARTTSTTRPRCSPSSTARRRPSSPREAADGARGGRPPGTRPRGERGGPARFLRAVELEPTLERRYQAARQPGGSTTCRLSAARWRLSGEEAQRGATPGLEARALTALADVTLLREADLRRAAELADQALAVVDPTDLVARSMLFRSGRMPPGGAPTSPMPTVT